MMLAVVMIIGCLSSTAFASAIETADTTGTAQGMTQLQLETTQAASTPSEETQTSQEAEETWKQMSQGAEETETEVPVSLETEVELLGDQEARVLDTGVGQTLIESITVISDMGLFGQQIAAAAIEYDQDIDASSLQADSFEMQALVQDTDGVKAAAPVAYIYTNDKPEMCEQHQGTAGKYVIVEFKMDYTNTVGRYSTTYFYDDNGTRKSQGYDYISWENQLCTVEQKQDITAMDGSILQATGGKVDASAGINLKIDEFRDLTLTSDKGGHKLPVKYYLPENYDASKKYPLVIQMVGGGTSYWEVGSENNFGVNIAGDPAATTWMDAAEDVIIVSPHTRFEVMNSTAPYDIIQTVNYFLNNYSVDENRVYLTGNSFGTIMSSRALRLAPDLFAAAVLCNGNLGLGAAAGPGDVKDTDPDAIKELMSEVVDQGTAIWFHHGRGDTTAKVEESIVPYEAIKQAYQSKGLSEEQIGKLLKISIYEDAEFDTVGITSYHSATRYAYYTYGNQITSWVLSQSKSNSARTAEEEFVNRLYEKILGRNPDTKGFSSWVNKLTQRQLSAAEVAFGFLFSQEYEKKNTSDSAYIDCLYKALLNRNPDAGGKATWQKCLDQGLSRKYVFAGFVNSDEFKQLCSQNQLQAGSYVSQEIVDRKPLLTEFVQNLYQNILGRKSDKNGLNYWVGNMLAGSISVISLVQGFFGSAEFNTLQFTESAFLTLVYQALLGRPSDSQGYQHWMSLLQSGKSRLEVLEGFLQSPEFGTFCGKYGISR